MARRTIGISQALTERVSSQSSNFGGVLVAAAGKTDDNMLRFRESGRKCHGSGDGMSTFDCRQDAFAFG